MTLVADKIHKKATERMAISVQEKILLEKQLPFNPNEKEGPTVDLYFHELVKKKTIAQQSLGFAAAIILVAVFAVSFPFIFAFIKIFSSAPVLKKNKVIGRRGMLFTHYTYSTKHQLGTFFRRSGLYKLPSALNILKGDMDLVGPYPYPVEWCNKWNNQYSDFYKRFSFKPGFLGVTRPVTNLEDLQQVKWSLKQELGYVLHPSFKKDRQRLMGKALS